MAAEIKKPVTTFRSGTVKAAVWKNIGKDGLFHTVTFSRSYKDAESKWKNTSSFGANDIDALAEVTFQAKLYIMENK